MDENEDSAIKVFIKDGQHIAYLTAAINDPSLLWSTKSLVVDHLNSVIVRGDGHVGISPRNALCFGKTLSRTAVFVWFGTALIIVLALSSVVFLTTHDMGVALAIGGFLLAILEAIQCLLLYQQTFSPM